MPQRVRHIAHVESGIFRHGRRYYDVISYVLDNVRVAGQVLSCAISQNWILKH